MLLLDLYCQNDRANINQPVRLTEEIGAVLKSLSPEIAVTTHNFNTLKSIVAVMVGITGHSPFMSSAV